MIITGFDGRNLQTITDALEVKILALGISLLVEEDFAAIAQIVNMDEFSLEPCDAEAVLRGMNVLLAQYASVAKPFKARPVDPSTGKPDEKKEVVN